MTDLRRFALALSLLSLAGCARVVAPAGGPEDKVAPRLLQTSPAAGDVGVARDIPIVLEFSEWVDPATLKSALVLMPAPSRSPEIFVDGPQVRLRLREPLDSGATTILRIGAGIADFRRAVSTDVREIAFSTGPSLDSGRLAIRVWKGSDSLAPVVVRARVGLYSLDSARRGGLSRLLRRRDSLSWLSAPPSPWREKAWRWAIADSQGIARLDHLPSGRWRVVAWDDGDQDGYWRPGEEALGWAGDLDWKGRTGRDVLVARLASLDTVVRAPSTAPKADSVAIDPARRRRDSLRSITPEAVAVKRRTDSLQVLSDSLQRTDSTRLDSLARRDASLPEDSVRTLVLDSLPADLAQATRVSIRLFRLDQRRRPLFLQGTPGTLKFRVPRGGKWAGEAWIDRDGDTRVGSGDPVRLIAAETWRALEPLTDDPASEEPILRLRPSILPADGANP